MTTRGLREDYKIIEIISKRSNEISRLGCYYILIVYGLLETVFMLLQIW